MRTISCFTHDLILGGMSESWCSHAFRCRDESRFWWIWVRVFTRRHCMTSFLYYHFRIDTHVESVINPFINPSEKITC